MLFGLSAALTKSVGDQFADGALTIFTDWHTYALVVVGYASMTLSQLSLQTGVLAPAVAMLGGPQRTVTLTSMDHRLEAPSQTFAGRDVMAPAAAYLADGTRITELGEEIDPVTLVPGIVPLPNESDDGVRLVGLFEPGQFLA